DTLESSAELDTVPAQTAVIVTEKDMAAVSGGLGYGSYARWFVNLQFMYRNLFGLGHQASVIARYSHYDRGGQLNYFYPHLFGNFADGQASAYGEQRFRPDFHGVFWGGSISVVNKSVNPLFTWRAAVRAEHMSNLDTDPPTPLYPGQPVRNTFALGGQLRSERQLNSTNPVSYESRLNNLLPVRSGNQLNSTNPFGWTADVRGELAGPFLHATNQFYTILPTLRLYYPVLNAAGITGVSGAQGAFGAGYGHTSGLLPVQERFWIGFETLLPVRGFNITELMPKDESGEARGAGAILVFTPLELRRPIYWRFQGALFVDVGHAWRNPGSLNMGDLRTAVGPGIMIPTAQGIIRLDYGIQVPQGKSRVTLYIENF
ncbi:MAG: BamA/TamA family outer membrane protein, partial [Chitinispirillales bacterium]|nr:BamA/TamA family outer membrane protein [Chitinispirillales bacterium]